MKKYLTLALFSIILSASSLFAKEVKGDTATIEGVKTIRLKGSHAERGYAYGFLMAKEIKGVVVDYFYKVALNGSALQYTVLKTWFLQNAEWDASFETEAKSMIEGIKDAGYLDSLKKSFGFEYTYQDLLMANSIVELASNFACSSIASWGEATKNDPELKGELVISRHLDWQYAPALYNNHLIMIHEPSESNEQPWISFGFPGLMGALSAVNKSGLCVFQHQGNLNELAQGKKYTPVHLSLRKSVEMKDIDGDGFSKTSDVVKCLQTNTAGGSFILVAANSIASGDSSCVIEYNGKRGAIVRTKQDNDKNFGDNLIATNHYRKMIAPDTCWRYKNLEDSLLKNTGMTINRNFQVLAGAAAQKYTLQTIQIVPAIGKVNFYFTNASKYSYEKAPYSFNINDVFKASSGIDDLVFENSLKVFPNPFIDKVNISSIDEIVSIEIYNLLGQRLFETRNISNNDISLSNLTNGSYILKYKIKSPNGEIEHSKIIRKGE